MTTASAYILLVPEGRRRVILDEVDGLSFYRDPSVAEPVPRFDHSKNVPLVVLASFRNGAITHVADGRKGAAAGTKLVRLNMKDLKALPTPLAFEEVIKRVPRRVQSHLARSFAKGGKLPPKTLEAVVDALLELNPALHGRLGRFSGARTEILRGLTPRESENLAYQKETLGAALDIAGISKEELLEWAPSPERHRTFLDDLSSVYVREDAMLAVDFSSMPGFHAIAGATHYVGKTFVDPRNSRKRLRVIMANRFALEEQTGADLIYYNEAYRSFVMVQYKAMEKSRDGNAEFRWKDGDNLSNEVERMTAMLKELNKVEPDADPDGFRFSSNPFFLKFCRRVTFNPDDKGLFKGIYVPLGLWSLAGTDRLKGPRSGNVLTYRNVGRYLTNSEFVPLVAKSWVGTTIKQSETLEKIIREVLQTGKTVTYAVQDKASAEAEDEIELDDGFTDDTDELDLDRD